MSNRSASVSRLTQNDAAMPDLAKMTRKQILILLSGIMLGLFLAALDQTIVATALPAISQDLGQIQQIPWIATSYLLASTVSVPMFGKISDLFGRKPLFQFAIWTFFIGSIACGVSQTMTQLIIARTIQGIAAGGLLTIPQAILGDIVAPRERGRYLGYIGVVWALSSIAGPSVGGFLTEQISWRWVFYINVPIGVAALVATTLSLNMPRVRLKHKIDYLGSILLAATSSCAVLALVSIGSLRSGSGSIAILFGVSIALLAGFILQERRAAEPILPLNLFRNSVLRVGSFLGFLVGVAMFTCVVYVPLYLQVALGASVSRSGFLLSPMLLTLVITTFCVGRLISAKGRYRIFPIVGTVLLNLGFGLVAVFSQFEIDWLIVAATMVIAVGVGCIMQVGVLAIQNSVARTDLGIATSTERLFRSIGSAVGVAAAGVILSMHLAGLPEKATSRSGSVAIERFLSGSRAGDLPWGSLPPEARTLLGNEVSSAVRTIFLAALPLSMTAFVVSFRLKELPLRSGTAGGTAGNELSGGEFD